MDIAGVDCLYWNWNGLDIYLFYCKLIFCMIYCTFNHIMRETDREEIIAYRTFLSWIAIFIHTSPKTIFSYLCHAIFTSQY